MARCAASWMDLPGGELCVITVSHDKLLRVLHVPSGVLSGTRDGDCNA